MPDIFISYAHSTDVPPPGAGFGWVTMLVEQLRNFLRIKRGGNGAEIWMDHRLAANQDVTAELLDKLRSSRILVLVMSPGYLESEWCQRELANFLLSAQARRSRENVFVLETEPSDRHRWPRALQDLNLTPVPFWDRELPDTPPRLLGYPAPPRDENSRYWKSLNNLAHWIRDRLGADDGGARPASRVVLVAETTDDLDEQRGSVVEMLRQLHDVEPVPGASYPRDTEAAYLGMLRDDLRQATLFVQLLGRYEGKRLPGGGSTAVALQAHEALAVQAERGLPVLQWRDPALDLDQVGSQAHRSLLTGPFVQACGFEQFRREVFTALSGAPRPALPSAARAAPTPASEGLRIFVEADDVDRDLAAAVRGSLESYGVEPVPAPGTAKESFARGIERHRELLRRCHGILFVYGKSTLAWLGAQLGYAAQAMGVRRDDVWGAVLDAAVPDQPRIPFTSRNLLNLDCRDGFDPAKLAAFVEALRAQPAVGRV